MQLSVARQPAVLDGLDLTIDPRNTRGWPRNRRQLEWASCYVIDGDTAFEAAIKAGYSRTTAKSKSGGFVRRLQPFLGHLQLHKNGVAEQRLNVTAERVVQGLAAIAFPNPAAYCAIVTLKGGTHRVVGKPPNELTSQQGAAVTSWTVTEHEGSDGTMVLDYAYNFADRVKALLGLAKCLGLLNERLQVGLLQAQAAHDRVDYTNVPTEALNTAIEQIKRIRAELRESAMPQDANSDQSYRPVHGRVMSSAA